MVTPDRQNRSTRTVALPKRTAAVAHVPFTTSDCWLLLSISFAGGRHRAAALRDIVAAGDAINHAIFTPREIRRGIAKLVRAGYVTDRKGKFLLRKAGRELVDRAASEGRSWLGEWDYLIAELRATSGPEDHAQFEDERFPYPSLTDEVIARACRDYAATFKSQ